MLTHKVPVCSNKARFERCFDMSPYTTPDAACNPQHIPRAPHLPYVENRQNTPKANQDWNTISRHKRVDAALANTSASISQQGLDWP